MGRRSINTTKSGKYMNPTDQARKEARKKELKKNKRQRMLVRTAVLKGKDPEQLLTEMEKIDQMEYNVLQPSPLNEKVLKDKRRKLKDTFERVMKMYVKDDPDKWEELKRAEVEYDKRRTQLVSYYEAVKHAQQVQVDDIPLPLQSLPPESLAALAAGYTSQIPLPSDLGIPLPPSILGMVPPAPSILRKRSAYSPPPGAKHKAPPGVPPGPPPELSEGSDSEDENSADNSNKSKSIRFAEESNEDKTKSIDEKENQDAMDTFMKEMEEIQAKVNANAASNMPKESVPPQPVPPPLSQIIPPPPPLMFRPPPPSGIRLPPGLPPPPLRLMNIRLPPGPPPGMPPRIMRFPPPPPMGIPLPPTPGQQQSSMSLSTPNVLSAGPQLINKSAVSSSGGVTSSDSVTSKDGKTISAKPKIRNLSADLTRFLPTTLRLKKGDDASKRSLKTPSDVKNKTDQGGKSLQPPTMPPSAPGQTKDDAYQQFMKEMQGLL
uniref:WW domain-binding protein 11 n=1 Tax=Cacopsylla melanoneura TaxID=428564 RepID=A0A8D8VBM6_9HEMI